jgi:hypothetical protein
MTKKMGRPSLYTEQLADEICELMYDGLSLIKACDALELKRSTVWHWMEQHPEFAAKCARARDALIEVRLDKIADKIEKGKADPAHLRIEVSHEQWVAERMRPRVTRTEISGPNGGAIQTEVKHVDLSHLSDEELEVLDRALNGQD